MSLIHRVTFALLSCFLVDVPCAVRAHHFKQRERRMELNDANSFFSTRRMFIFMRNDFIRKFHWVSELFKVTHPFPHLTMVQNITPKYNNTILEWCLLVRSNTCFGASVYSNRSTNWMRRMCKLYEYSNAWMPMELSRRAKAGQSDRDFVRRLFELVFFSFFSATWKINGTHAFQILFECFRAIRCESNAYLTGKLRWIRTLLNACRLIAQRLQQHLKNAIQCSRISLRISQGMSLTQQICFSSSSSFIWKLIVWKSRLSHLSRGCRMHHVNS